eukprot:PITA_17605
MLLRSSSSPIPGSINPSPILGSINPMLQQPDGLKELEPESRFRRCKSAKPLSSSCAFGSGTWDLEAEIHMSPPKSFKPAHKIAVVVDHMGSENPFIWGRKHDVLRPTGVEGGSGSIPVPRISQLVSETENGAMYIAGGFGNGGVNQEVSSTDSVSECTEVHFQKMLEANPGNSLLLRNYAKFLHEVQGNLAKAEKYYGRAILASPGDGEVLTLYANLMWEVRRDASHAEAYFDQAVQANPDDCFVLGSYAHFLWDSEENESGNNDSEMQQRTAAPVMFQNSATEGVV